MNPYWQFKDDFCLHYNEGLSMGAQIAAASRSAGIVRQRESSGQGHVGRYLPFIVVMHKNRRAIAQAFTEHVVM